MKLELMEAGLDVERYALIVTIGDAAWRIPTDEATALRLAIELNRRAVRTRKVPYQGPDLDDLIR